MSRFYTASARRRRVRARGREKGENLFVGWSANVGRSANDSHAVAALHVHDALAAACLSADTPFDFVKIDVEGSEARVFAVDSAHVLTAPGGRHLYRDTRRHGYRLR